MIYKLPGGSRVKTIRVGEATEFITSNAQGEVVSTVRKSGADAASLVRELIYADHRTKISEAFNIPVRLLATT
jgi:hypothetical protein